MSDRPPHYPCGVTHDMAEAGAEAFTLAGYTGVTRDVGVEDKPFVLATPVSVGMALVRAFPAMADRMEGGPRDTLLHPGPIGGDDLTGWAAMPPRHRAQHVHHQAPAYLLGVASTLHRQRHEMAASHHNAALGFLADAVTALARQLGRANAVLRRVEEDDRQRRVHAAEELAAQQAQAVDAARVAGARAARRPKKPAKARKRGGA